MAEIIRMRACALRLATACMALSLMGALPSAKAQAQANVNNGFYFGISLAGVFAEQDVLEIEDPGPPPVIEEGTAELNAVGGTLAIGFRAPIGSNIIAGIEADVTVGNFEDNYDGDNYHGDYLATLRAIFGMEVGASTFLYLTGGIAFLDANYVGDLPMAPMTVGSADETLIGFAVGGGAEFGIGMGGVKIRTQYLYTSFEDWQFVTNGEYYDVDSDAHIAQIGFVIPFPN